jgi:hypothetical protein
MGYNFSIAGVCGRTHQSYARGGAMSVGMARLETAGLFKSGVNRTLQWKVQLMCANPSVLSLKLDGTDFML